MESTVKQIGKVKFFNITKGYGFIKMEDESEIFCHVTNIEGTVGMDDSVSFYVKDTEKGKKATNVAKI